MHMSRTADVQGYLKISCNQAAGLSWPGAKTIGPKESMVSKLMPSMPDLEASSAYP